MRSPDRKRLMSQSTDAPAATPNVVIIGAGPAGLTAAYELVAVRFAKRTLGSVFLGANTVVVTIDQLLEKESGK